MLGVITQEQVLSGDVPLIAPGFCQRITERNVLAGNAMGGGRYMYGNLLEPSATGFVSTGLGASLSLGSTGFIVPSDTVSETGETRTIDGIEIEFQMTMGTEAPAEFVFYLPKFKALCMSEITSHQLHNVYTLRGAQVRDCLAGLRKLTSPLTCLATAWTYSSLHILVDLGSGGPRVFGKTARFVQVHPRPNPKTGQQALVRKRSANGSACHRV